MWRWILYSILTILVTTVIIYFATTITPKCNCPLVIVDYGLVNTTKTVTESLINGSSTATILRFTGNNTLVKKPVTNNPSKFDVTINNRITYTPVFAGTLLKTITGIATGTVRVTNTLNPPILPSIIIIEVVWSADGLATFTGITQTVYPIALAVGVPQTITFSLPYVFTVTPGQLPLGNATIATSITFNDFVATVTTYQYELKQISIYAVES